MMCLEELLFYARNTFKFASRETGENVSDCFLVEFSPRSGKSEDLYFSKKKAEFTFCCCFFMFIELEGYNLHLSRGSPFYTFYTIKYENII